MSAGDVATYSVPNCPWCGMLSRSKPEHHREWETVCMECRSEIYPPRATSPSVQSKACKEIAALRAQLAERCVVGPDEVVVKREEWAALGQIVTLVNKHINDPCYLRNQLVPIVDRVSAIRSGEAGKGAG